MQFKTRDINEFKAIKRKSKYSIKLVNILYAKHREMSHGELCEALSIKKNYLSNIVKLLDAFNILFIDRIGRNVYYSLTAQGYLFHEYCEKEQTSSVFKKGTILQPVFASKAKLLSDTEPEINSHKKTPLSRIAQD